MSYNLSSFFYTKSKRIKLILVLVAVILTISAFSLYPRSGHAVDISDTPIEITSKSTPPLVVFVLDDSGSMDWECMTSSGNSSDGNLYMFPKNPGDNNYTTITLSNGYMNESERRKWRTQWAGYNTLYYKPKSPYIPWPNNSGTGNLPNADTVNPRSNPLDTNCTLNLKDTYYTVAVQGKSVPVMNSHYFIVNDLNGNNVAESNEDIYMVNIENGQTRAIFRYNDKNGNESVDDNELTPVSLESIPVMIRPPDNIMEDLQNFANWYTYYRRRSHSAKAAVSKAITSLSGMKIGFYSINKNLIQGVLPIKISNTDSSIQDESLELLTKLYNLKSSGGTELREGLDAVGRYFQGGNPNNMGPSPFETASNGGICQRAYAIVMTDGFWTETKFTLSQQDPNKDGYNNTLADVAYKYYSQDLRLDLANFIKPTDCDPNTFQHLVTYTLSFGVQGTIKPAQYDPCTLLDIQSNTPAWPNPYCAECKEKTDDLWHAAAITKGKFFNASNPEELAVSLEEIFSTIDNNENQGSAVQIANERFYESTSMYQATYQSTNWTGDVRSYKIEHDRDGENLIISNDSQWSASEKLKTKNGSNRNIITYDGLKGIPFTWNDITANQKSQLSNDEDMLRYIRGENNPKYRQRESKLGDIVHSSPLLKNNLIYVGANDGMLHVFDSKTGEEKFAYIPSSVFPNLKKLADKNYHHQFFVDMTPVSSDLFINKKQYTYLVGGLGKGGKGYYCLDITGLANSSTFNENSLKDIIRWEFTDKDNLGYTFSEPVIVKTRSSAYPYVVIFGNGYNSKTGFAQLYVLDAVTGKIIRLFNTDKGNDNGLSSPIVTDVNNDGSGDYVYAGDLKGNLWKWDIRNANPNEWDFSYRNDTNKPVPLFKTPDKQPITTRPDVMRHCSKHGYIVCFGTGKYLGLTDLQTNAAQSIYGIWDYGDDQGEYLGTFSPKSMKLSNHPDSGQISVRLNPQTILEESIIDKSTIRTISTNKTNYAVIPDCEDPNPNQKIKNCNSLPNPMKHAGWFLNLPPNEIIAQNVHIRNNVLTVISKMVSGVPCSEGGKSMVYFLNPCTGGMTRPASTITETGKINQPVYITNKKSQEMMVFNKNMKSMIAPNGGVKSGMYFWREL